MLLSFFMRRERNFVLSFVTSVAVKAKPECCSEQNRNPEKKLVERASVHDFALKTTIVEG